MRGEHDFGVLPLGGPVVAGNQPHPVQTTKVTEHKGVAALRVVGRAIGRSARCQAPYSFQPWASRNAFCSRGTWLNVGPTSAHPVLMSVDELPSLGDTPPVHQVPGHELSLPNRAASHAAFKSVRCVVSDPGQAARLTPENTPSDDNDAAVSRIAGTAAVRVGHRRVTRSASVEPGLAAPCGLRTIAPVAYDEELADRIRELIADTVGLAEQRMFGGLRS